MSIGVIIASTIIYIWPTAKIADPICTFVFSVIVCVTVYPILSNCIMVLMEGAPDEIDQDDLKEAILNIDPDQKLEIFDFKVWYISHGKYAMTAHVVCEKNPTHVSNAIHKKVTDEYYIDFVTVQTELHSGEDYTH